MEATKGNSSNLIVWTLLTNSLKGGFLMTGTRVLLACSSWGSIVKADGKLLFIYVCISHIYVLSVILGK